MACAYVLANAVPLFEDRCERGDGCFAVRAGPLHLARCWSRRLAFTRANATWYWAGFAGWFRS
eukprot:5176857-Alexandrium_andersonii.AAC.1